MADIHPAGFTLAELIESTADELRKVRNKHREDAVIQLTSCELEMAVTIGAEAGGGIKFWLVDASAKAKGESVSRVKLSFKPIVGGLSRFDLTAINAKVDVPGQEGVS